MMRDHIDLSRVGTPGRLLTFKEIASADGYYQALNDNPAEPSWGVYAVFMDNGAMHYSFISPMGTITNVAEKSLEDFKFRRLEPHETITLIPFR